MAEAAGAGALVTGAAKGAGGAATLKSSPLIAGVVLCLRLANAVHINANVQ